MNARESILRRLRAAQATARLPHVDAAPPRPTFRATPEACLARFTIELAALGVTCYVCDSADDVRRRVADVVGSRVVLSWDAEWLPYGAAQALVRPLFAEASRTDQAAAAIGVTGCDAAIAETGSLVLLSGPGRSRAVSLLPPVHLAIVERHRLCFSMAEMFTAYYEPFRDARSCTIITGPSRTADIELTLTLGIHGPGEVIVIVGS
jgi:L-lactate dehydrogenase complex protein LldG